MNIEHVPLESLRLDPQNARLHSARNLEAIRRSLERFGQQKPLVVDDNNIIRAGNGTYAAAKQLGWATIAVLRSALSAAELRAYAIADNRTGDLSTFSMQAIAEAIDELSNEDQGLVDALAFSDAELHRLTRRTADALDGATQSADSAKLSLQRRVVVVCRDETDQAALYDELRQRGYECQLLML